MNSELDQYLIDPGKSLRDVMSGLNLTRGFVVVVDSGQRLLGTVTDGDIRRSILADVDLDQPVDVLLRQPWRHATPLTAPVGTAESKLLQMMTEAKVRHIPLVDASGRVCGVASLEDLVRDYELPLTAVVMAGGLGTRLRPLTEDLPKPMLPVGGRPLMEHIIGGLRAAGIRKVNITTHYKGELIEDHFGDGSDFGVDIEYVDEEEPLGTAGALSLLEASDEPFLIINGDIVTKVDLRAMLDYHTEHRADMTVALRHHEYTVPFGVVDIDGVELTGIREKPTQRLLINAGIYLVGPEAAKRVPDRSRYDMTDLIHDAIGDGLKVVGFPVQEYWMDVGQMADYEKAQAEAAGP